MLLDRIVVNGFVYFVVLKGSFSNVNISSCCTNLFSTFNFSVILVAVLDSEDTLEAYNPSTVNSSAT